MSVAVAVVTILLDNGNAEPAGDIEVTVSLSGELQGVPFTVSASKIVTVLDTPSFRMLSGTLSCRRRTLALSGSLPGWTNLALP